MPTKHYHLANRSSNDKSCSTRNNSFSFCGFLAQKSRSKPTADDDEEVDMMVVMILEFKQRSADNLNHVSFNSANVTPRVS